jgi:hypothetical protein
MEDLPANKIALSTRQNYKIREIRLNLVGKGRDELMKKLTQD